MPSSLTGSSAGDFWHRLGLVEATFLDVQALYGGTATSNVGTAAQLSTRLTSITTDLVAGTPDYAASAALDTAIVSAQSSGPNALGSALQGMIQTHLVTLTNTLSPLPILSLGAAVEYLINKMAAGTASINHGTPPSAGTQTAGIAATPVGNPSFVVGVVDSAGRSLQYLYPETLTFEITQDAQNGATAGQEPYSVSGQNGNSNPFSYDWLTSKYGSGASGTGSLVDPAVSNTGSNTGNLTVNGTFTTFTTINQADNWTYAVGVATTNFTNGTGTAYYTGQGSLGMLSAGGTLNAVTQTFNTTSSTTVGAGGTPYALVASAVNNTQYAVFVAVKLSTGTPTNGTLTVDLITGDGTVLGSTVISDDSAVANTFAIDLTAITDTNWHSYTHTFRLPQALVTGPYKLRLAFTGTILDNGVTCYVGAVGVAIMTQLYAGGPYFVGFRGATAPNASGIHPDSWTVALTYTPGKLQKAAWRWFGVPSLAAQTPGLVIPALDSGSATIADSLVA